MTVFGIYIVILTVVGIVLNLFYAGRGGVTHSPAVLIIAAVWAALNLLGYLFLGTGLGVW